MERRADRKVRPLYFADEILLLLVLELEGWAPSRPCFGSS